MKNVSLVEEMKDMKKLFDASKVSWAIYAGAAAFAYGCDRAIRDVDIIVPKKDETIVRSVLRSDFEEQSVKYRACEIQAYTMKIDKIEIAIDPRVTVGGGSYIFSFDCLMNRRKRHVRMFKLKAPVISVEDNIAFKCLLQRGVEDDKDDLEDARDMLFRNRIDFGYLKYRVKAIGAGARIFPALQKLLLE